MNDPNMVCDYLMESPFENNRLANKVNPKVFIRDYLQKVITPCANILDVGCGPANITREIAITYPDTMVTGLDISSHRLLEASRIQSVRNLNLIAGNVYKLPFPDNSFDLIFSRLLFEYLKQPLEALKEMKRICKTGGTVLIQDIDGQFIFNYPEDIQLMSQIDIIFNELKKHTGFDPIVGRKLYHMFYKNGFLNTQVRMTPYHLIYGKINEENDQYWKDKLITVLPKLRKMTVHNKIDIDRIIHYFLNYLRREDTLTFSNLFTVYGVK